jgi:hypothetical protein
MLKIVYDRLEPMFRSLSQEYDENLTKVFYYASIKFILTVSKAFQDKNIQEYIRQYILWENSNIDAKIVKWKKFFTEKIKEEELKEDVTKTDGAVKIKEIKKGDLIVIWTTFALYSELLEEDPDPFNVGVALNFFNTKMSQEKYPTKAVLNNNNSTPLFDLFLKKRVKKTVVTDAEKSAAIQREVYGDMNVANNVANEASQVRRANLAENNKNANDIFGGSSSRKFHPKNKNKTRRRK